MATKAMSVREKFSVEFVSTSPKCAKAPSGYVSELPEIFLFESENASDSDNMPGMFFDAVDPVAELRALFNSAGN